MGAAEAALAARRDGRSRPAPALAHQADVVAAGCSASRSRPTPSHALKTGYDLPRSAGRARCSTRSASPPPGCCPTSCAPGTRLGEVCAARRRDDRPARRHAGDRRDDRRLRRAARRGRARARATGTRCSARRSCSRAARGDRFDDPAGVRLLATARPDGGWLPGGASSTGAGVLRARRSPAATSTSSTARAQALRAAPACSPTRSSRAASASRSRARDAEAFVLGEPADEAEPYAALLQGVALRRAAVLRLRRPARRAAERRAHAHRRRDPQPRTGASCAPTCSAGRVRLVEQPEAAVGMAILAAADGRGGDAAAEMVRTREVVEPRRRSRRTASASATCGSSPSSSAAAGSAARLAAMRARGRAA